MKRLFGTGCLLALLLLPGQALAGDRFSVQSRNLYLGADLMPLAIYGSDPAQLNNFSKTVSWVWGNVQKTKWNTRVKGLAKELKTNQPDLVGLQEAALWRRGTSPAGAPTKVVYDYTSSLLAEAKRQGVRYRVVASQNEFDFVVPSSLGYKLRFTQRDVILARVGSKLSTGAVRRGQYTDTFVADTPAGQAVSKRGWLAVDVKTPGKKSFRFVTTHLEAYGDAVRANQATQLAQTGLNVNRPLVLVGDMNSDPQDAGAAGAAYRNLVGFGMTNTFSIPVATDGQNSLVNNPVSQLSHWIDHILIKGSGWTVRSTGVFGDKASDRVGGLWPSDHAGVIARLQLG